MAPAGSPLSRRFYLFLVVTQSIVIATAVLLLVISAIDRDRSGLLYPVLLLVLVVPGLTSTVRRQRRAVSRRQRLLDRTAGIGH